MLTDAEINELIALAKPSFLDLFRKQRISLRDIADKRWYERFAVAVELWHRCDSSAREALATDPNYSVRNLAMQKRDDPGVCLMASAKELPALDKLPFRFVHQGDHYSGAASVEGREWSMLIDQMPHLLFQLALDEVEGITILLPTDKKGRRPSIVCSTIDIPILEVAIPAALMVLQRALEVPSLANFP